MLLSTLVSQYADYLKTVRPLSEKTVANYLCRVRRFAEHLGEDAALPALTRQTILRYIHRVGAHSPHAVRMHHAAIRHFCEWLKTEEWVNESPCANIPLPKLTRRRRETVPDDAVQKLVEACDRLPRTEYKRTLAKAVMALLVYAGLRRSEALRVRMEDVHLDRGEIFVASGKGKKSRPAYLCREGIHAVRDLLKVRPDCDHDYLLAYNRRYGLMYHGLRNLLDDLHRIAGLKERYTPHQLRHAYASRLARNGAPLPAIQKALGHTRLETTAIYLHADDEQVRAIAHLASLSPVKPEPETPKTAPTPPAAKREETKRFRVRRLR